MISRENYEIWMIDYLDGILTGADQKLLLHFLDENPDLKSELEGMDKAVLVAPENRFDHKDGLLKTEADEFGIDYPDYLAIKQTEEGLSQEEVSWKNNYLSKKESDKSLFNTYSKIHLKADSQHTYKQKASLKRAILLPYFNQSTWRKISAAAILVLVLTVGALPFLKDQTHLVQTLVVNDPPSLIKLPPATSKLAEAAVEKEELLLLPQKESVKQTGKLESVEVKKIEYIFIEPIQPKRIGETISTKTLNAYEVGLNAMMPLLIANNLEQRNLDELDRKNYIQEESVRLSRSSKALASSIKVINFLAGNETTVKKYMNEDGELVAYQLESDHISISRKIKNINVTN